MSKQLLNHTRNLKPRTLLLFGCIICVIGSLSFAFMGRGDQALQNQPSTAAKIPQITAIPGNVTSEKYKSLQEEDNQKRAQLAQRTGGSAIATIIGARSKDSLEKQQTLGIEDQLGGACPTCNCAAKEDDGRAVPMKCPLDGDAAIAAASHDKAAALQLLNDCPTLAEAFAKKYPALFKELLLENPSLAKKIAQVDPTFMKKILLDDTTFAKQLFSSNPEVLKTLLAGDPSFAEDFAKKNPALFKQILANNSDLAKQLAQLDPAFMKKLLADDPAFSKELSLRNPEAFRIATAQQADLSGLNPGQRDQNRALSIEALRRKEQEARAQAARQSQLNDQQQKQLALLVANMEAESKKVTRNLEEVTHQAFVQGDDTQTTDSKTADGKKKSETTGNDSGGSKHVLIKAGTILYASLDTAINSDEPGPVMATIVQGDFKGSKAIGAIQPAASSIDNRPEKVILNFTTLSPLDASKSFSITAVAVDPDSARTALASDVDHHYLLRYGTLLGSAFMTGYAKVITSQGSSIQTNNTNNTTTTTMPPLNNTQQITAALGQVGQSIGTATSTYFNTPNTITVDQGTGFGLLILNDVSET